MFAKSDKKNEIINKLHNVILNVHAKKLTIEEAYRQLALNYTQICRDTSHSEFASILDTFETIIHYYDSYTPEGGSTVSKNFFNPTDNPNIGDFIYEIRDYIKSEAPFISVPEKEANLLQSIKNALDSNIKELGNTALIQISEEIVNKENLLKKKDREIKRATTISIIGVIFTIIFGIITVLQFFM